MNEMNPEIVAGLFSALLPTYNAIRDHFSKTRGADYQPTDVEMTSAFRANLAKGDGEWDAWKAAHP